MWSQSNARGGYMETRTASTGERAWLTVPEVAEELHIPRTRAYELIARGELPAVRVGERSIRVNRNELERFLLESRRIAGQK
jgi:excisionase family DNA binding protein